MTPASTLRAYPRAKFVQATPIDIAEYGSFFLEGDNSREQLIEEWERIIATLGLKINDREEVVEVVRDGDLLTVKTASGNSYRTRALVLAIGVRGNARHLNLPGEEPGRVFYTLIEPTEFQRQKILVVGGGNAGAEVAQALAAAELGNRVSYSFHAPVLTNVSRENAEKISMLQRANLITLYPGTTLKEIKPGKIVLEPVKNPATNTTPSRNAPDGPARNRQRHHLRDDRCRTPHRIPQKDRHQAGKQGTPRLGLISVPDGTFRRFDGGPFGPRRQNYVSLITDRYIL